MEKFGSFEVLFRPVLFDQAWSFLSQIDQWQAKQHAISILRKFKIVTVYLSKKHHYIIRKLRIPQYHVFHRSVCIHAQVNSGRYHCNYIQCKKRAIPKSFRWIDFVCCLSSIWCVSRCWFVTSKRLLPHLILLSCRLVTRIGFNQTRHSQPYKLWPSKLNQYHLIYSFQACEVEKALKRTKYLSCALIIVFQK